MHAGIHPSLGADTPQEQTHTPPKADPPGTYTPWQQTPPGKQTPAHGLRAAGTPGKHPTGMYSCNCKTMKTRVNEMVSMGDTAISLHIQHTATALETRGGVVQSNIKLKVPRSAQIFILGGRGKGVGVGGMLLQTFLKDLREEGSSQVFLSTDFALPPSGSLCITDSLQTNKLLLLLTRSNVTSSNPIQFSLNSAFFCQIDSIS